MFIDCEEIMMITAPQDESDESSSNKSLAEFEWFWPVVASILGIVFIFVCIGIHLSRKGKLTQVLDEIEEKSDNKDENMKVVKLTNINS